MTAAATAPAGVDSSAAADSPELAALHAAFDRGDIAETRRQATALLGRGETAGPVRQEAERLLAATSNDPVALYLGLACLAFFVVVVYFTLVR